jgi:tRNA-2-methylthio-N6-dimethylallyladenosine synthase
MGRGYDSSYYRDLIARARDTIPELSLATDVIVGFPGESHQQFMNTYRLLEDLRFDVVHIASYSPRPGTSAARLPDDVPPEEKRRRHRAVEELHTSLASEINTRFLDRVLDVLVEDQQKGKWMGRTRSNKLVFFPHSQDQRGKLVRVRITQTSPWSMQGQLAVES